jgi:chromosome segregation protein
MRLTALEIKGFKSFADKTIINFNDNITGIVGPNGCGKSNIVDAIRWVLGEQKSKSLRSEKMENVIFNGTNTRKQAAMAEVNLTFENNKGILPTEYNTVNISRALYRDGTSEYKLNNVACRLKDITSLLIDTGIGSDSYAIIELGMVDEILTDRDNSRMMLLEQAAGVSKYKLRKKETLLKLQATDNDLSRVQDIVFEIEGQLKTLEKQAKRAEKYYEIKKEYKEAAAKISKIKLKSIQDNINITGEKIIATKDLILSLQTNINQKESSIASQKLEIIEKEKGLSNQQKELNELINEIRNNENKKQITTQKASFDAEKLIEYEKQLLRNEEEKNKLQKDVQFNTESLKNESNKIEDLKNKNNILVQQLDLIKQQYKGLQSNVENLMQHFSEKEKIAYNTEKEILIHKTKIENQKNEISRDEKEHEKNKEDLIILETQLQHVEQSKNQFEISLQTAQKKEQSHLNYIEEVTKKLELIRHEQNDINRKIDLTENEYKITKNLVENLEGFPESIRFLKKQSHWNIDFPLLSDIIYCDEKYRICIENYLGAYLNYYVVQHYQQAFDGVELLNKASQGRANFFILSEIKLNNNEINSEIVNGISAYEIIECEPQYKSLFAYLLQDVYISENENINLPNEQITILSPNGKYTKSKYIVSGGSIGLFEGKKIGRKKNLEKLHQLLIQYKEQQAKIKHDFAQIENELKKLKNITFKNEIQGIQHQLTTVTNQYISCKTKIENVQIYFDKTLSKREAMLAIIEKLNIEISNAEKLHKNQLLEVENAKKQLNEADEKQTEQQLQLSNASANFNENNIACIQQENLIKNIEQEIKYKEKQLNNDIEQTAQLKLNIEKTNKNILENKLIIEKTENELLAQYETKTALDKYWNENENSFFQAKEAINEIENEIRKTIKQKNEQEVIQNTYQQENNELKIQMLGITERMNIEFNMQIEDIEKMETIENENLDQLEDQSKKIKNKLENYGEINPMAMEAYNEIQERYNFIIAQRKDLIDAKTLLSQTMNEIEEKATTQLMEAYSKVRDSFIKVFRSLFTENDKCDLILTNPENPLESGLEITAQPKGKRPQTINQLSGGEKTLTAIALLFSLYLLKPAPFCIFDEVDAPLDDTNIGKFNKIITDFSDNSQFILVTHNKQTMTVAKSIYGVTMIHQGISSVVPVDFSNLI